MLVFSEDSSGSMSSPVRQDSMSEYSNMSEPGKLEIDTGSAPANTDNKSGADNEVSNVCTVWQRCSFHFLLLPQLYYNQLEQIRKHWIEHRFPGMKCTGHYISDFATKLSLVPPDQKNIFVFLFFINFSKFYLTLVVRHFTTTDVCIWKTSVIYLSDKYLDF